MKEGKGTDGEEQTTIQVEDSNPKRKHGEQTTSMTIEDETQIISPPIQAQTATNIADFLI